MLGFYLMYINTNKKQISVHYFINYIIFEVINTYLLRMKIAGQEKLIRTIIVSNEKRVDVFRIHVFENSLKFDPLFAYGISKNTDVYNMVINIENLWIERKIELSDVFNMMVGVLEKHENYLEQYYFKPEELDITGRLSTLRPYSVFGEKNYTYFMCLKNKDNLKNITRKEFESNMKDEEIAYSYIENYAGKDVKFFNYQASGLKDKGKNCFFMMVGDNIKVGVVKR